MQWLKLITLFSGSLVIFTNAASINRQKSKPQLIKSEHGLDHEANIFNASAAGQEEVSTGLEGSKGSEFFRLAEQENAMPRNGSDAGASTTNNKRAIDMWETRFRLHLLKSGKLAGECNLNADIWYNYDKDSNRHVLLHPPSGTDFRPTTEGEGLYLIDDKHVTTVAPTNIYKVWAMDIHWDYRNTLFLDTEWVVALPNLQEIINGGPRCWDDFKIYEGGFEMKLSRCITWLGAL